MVNLVFDNKGVCDMSTPLLRVANAWCSGVAMLEVYTALDALTANLWGRLYYSPIAHSFTHSHAVSPLYNLLKAFRTAWIEMQ